jgi:hypothetical protein
MMARDVEGIECEVRRLLEALSEEGRARSGALPASPRAPSARPAASTSGGVHAPLRVGDLSEDFGRGE